MCFDLLFPFTQHHNILTKKHFNLSSTSLSLQIDLQKEYPVPECFVRRGVSVVKLLTMSSAIKQTIKKWKYLIGLYRQEEFEDTKEVIRRTDNRKVKRKRGKRDNQRSAKHYT